MGILGVYRDAVTLVNRTDRELNVRYDGEDIVLKPGKNPGFPLVAVPYAKRQNPLMGSKHPINPSKFISLVGVEAAPGEKQKDDVSPIPAEVLARADRKLEVVDRSGEFYGRSMKQNVKILNQGFDPYEAGVEGGSSMDIDNALSTRLG